MGLRPISPIATTSRCSRRSAPGNPTRSRSRAGAIRSELEALSVSDSTLPLLAGAARARPALQRKKTIRRAVRLRVVLTYGYWQRRFGGAENVIGQPLEIDGTPARSSACCRRRSSSCASIPPCCCRSSSIARTRFRIEIRLPGAGAAEAGRHAGPGQRRRGAHDPAAAAGLRAIWSCGRTCARWPRRDRRRRARCSGFSWQPSASCC